MFNGLPEIFENKVQNAEIYMQKRIYDSLQILNLLPIEQNETGLFSNYISGDVEVGKPLYTNNGIAFNEIKFGQGQVSGGQTLPNGYMYHANTRDKQRGKYDSSLESFFNTSVTQLADFFEEKYTDAIFNGGRASSVELEDWDTAEHIITNELLLDDEMRYDANDNRTGYAPNTAIVSRKTKISIDSALRREDYTSNYNYIASTKLNNDDFIIFDKFNPGGSIQKYADPDYSIVQSLANDGVTTTEDGEPIPKALINIKEDKTGRPQTVDYYVWVESNFNMNNSNGFLIVGR